MSDTNQPLPLFEEKKPEMTEETRRLKENFQFIGPATFIYALFYAFCMYQNDSGITFVFFIGSSLLLLTRVFAKLQIILQKSSFFYFISMMLLAVSTFCTDDWRIIAMNKTAIFLLMMSLLLDQFYDTTRWKLGKYLKSILQMAVMSFGELGRPFTDAKECYSEAMKRNKKWMYAMLGVVLTIPLLAVVLLLLSSADVLFRVFTERMLGWIHLGNIFGVFFTITWMFLFSYALLSFLCKRKMKEEVKEKRVGEPIFAIMMTSMLTLVYLLFSGIQIFGLFLGKMQLPEGYTYAQYAREGFFQLLVVSILNLIIVLLCMSYFKESKVLKGILTVMSFCTFVMIASSFLRMLIYVKYYDLTFLRILVLWTLIVLFVLFIGVVIAIFKERFPLFRYSVVVVTMFYLVLSFSHPDYIIASYNVTHSAEPDYYYLECLSADAASVMIPYEKRIGESYYELRMKYKTEDMSWRTFNVSRYLAKNQIEK